MPQPNDVLADRYRLLELRGRGGMAEVFAALDETLDRQVALKVLAPHLLDDPRALDRFRREARTAAAVIHPNVVTLFDTVTDGETNFLVMELMPGPTLAQHLAQEGALPVDETIRITRQVAEGLAAAHAVGLVHRDIKPSNILFDGSGNVKVTDFGIAGAVDATSTMTSNVYGSVGYISPEQARGEKADGRADLYSLGCVIFEMLTGRPPFRGDSPTAVLSQQLHQPAPAPSTIEASVPPPLDAIVLRLLAKQPEHRHPDAASLLEDLARGESTGAPMEATQPLTGPVPAMGMSATVVMDPRESTEGAARPPRPGKGRPSMAVVVTALVVTAVMGVGLALASRDDPTSRAAAEPTPSASTASTTPTPAPTDTPPTTPDEAADDIRQLLAAGRADGQVTARRMNDIEGAVSDALKKRGQGKANDLAKKMDELREDLGKFVEDGELDADLAEELRKAIDTFEQLAS